MSHDEAVGSADVANAEQAARSTIDPHATYVDKHWTLVSDLPAADDADFSDEEVEYITVDLGDTLPEEALHQLGSLQMTDLTTGEPFIRIGNEFLRGRHETLLGSALLFVQPPADPDSTKYPLLQPLGTTQARMAFEDVQLISKVKGTFIPGQTQYKASDFLLASGRGSRGARKGAAAISTRGGAGSGRGRGRPLKADSMDVDDAAEEDNTNDQLEGTSAADASANGDATPGVAADTSIPERGKSVGRGSRAGKSERGTKATRGGRGRGKKAMAASTGIIMPAESPQLPNEAGDASAPGETSAAANASDALLDVEEFDGLPAAQSATQE